MKFDNFVVPVSIMIGCFFGTLANSWGFFTIYILILFIVAIALEINDALSQSSEVKK